MEIPTSVADPGCLSRIPDPDFYPSRIQKQQQKRGVKKKFVVITFYVATNLTKLQIILFLKCWRQKIEPIFKKLYNFLPKKLSLSSQKYGFGIRDPEKPIPDPGSGSATLIPTLCVCAGRSRVCTRIGCEPTSRRPTGWSRLSSIRPFR